VLETYFCAEVIPPFLILVGSTRFLGPVRLTRVARLDKLLTLSERPMATGDRHKRLRWVCKPFTNERHLGRHQVVVRAQTRIAQSLRIVDFERAVSQGSAGRQNQ
jgi:hypothetical protein